MISIIISTYQPHFLEALKNNIEQTSGVPYEIIAIENRGEKSICEVYNKGIQLAQYKYLCFVHEDVLFHTNNWGRNILNHFEDLEVGAIAIAGTTYFSKMPGGWWSSGLTCHNLLQSTKNNSKPSLESKGDNPFGKNQIIAFDGVFFCVRKKVFDKISFDDATFKHFHYYDADISIQLYLNNFKVFCVYNILIQHFSLGTLNNTWINEAFVFQKKWENILPISLPPISKQIEWSIEFAVLHEFIQILLKNGYSKKETNFIAVRQIFKYKLSSNKKVLIKQAKLLIKACINF